MQSPARNYPAPAATSQDFDLGHLKRQLLVRNEEHQYLTRSHNNERQQLESAAERTQNSLVVANATLSKKQQALDENERDMAKISAMRNRQLQSKEEKLANVETQAAARRDQAAQLQQDIRNAEAELSDLRRGLAKSQLDVEEARQNQVRATHDSAQVDHEVEKSKERHAAMNAAQKHQKEILERRINDLDRDSSTMTETSRRFANTVSVNEGSHQERVTKVKLECDNIRHEVNENQSHIAALRSSVSDAQRDNEESQRKRRKADEEALTEHVAARKADLQKLRSSRDEQVRLLRAETARQRDALSTQLDGNSQTLVSIREEVNGLFEEEMNLQALISAQQEALIGTEVLEQRVQNARATTDIFNEKLNDLEENTKKAEHNLQELNTRSYNLKDTVAPLPEVESSIAQLNQRAEHQRNTMADNEADQAIWKVQSKEAENEMYNSIAKTSADIEDAIVLAKDIESRNEEQLSAMNSEGRVLATEMDALDAKIAELKARNETLDSTLDHVTRQRRAMMEEANARRDAARNAAASLLAQLE